MSEAFVVHVLNFLQQRPEWCETAVVLAYDDSDGWYDHQRDGTESSTTRPARRTRSPARSTRSTGVGRCGTNGPTTALPGSTASRTRRDAAATVAPAASRGLTLGREELRIESHGHRSEAPSSASSGISGSAVSASATARSTPSRTRSTACSISAARRSSTRSSIHRTGATSATT